MKRLFYSCLIGLLAVGTFIGRVAQAEHPEFLSHYRIVPRLSTLGITGGFAGIHERYRLSGQYDLHYGFHHDTATPPGSFASFENAEVWGSLLSDHPTIAIVLDVDERLNLEGLKGEQLPVAAPFDVYKFTGQTSDGSDLTLFASVIGPWMYVHGESQPPADGADFFDYHLRMVARSPRPFADFNGDGKVDAADYTVLRDTQSSATVSATLDGASLSDWQSQFGEQVPDFSAIDAMADAAFAGSASPLVVPEPSAVVLLLVGVISLALRAWASTADKRR